MDSWMTATEIAGRYLVSEERLLSYGQRGNLPWRRLADGTTLFDERVVASFFKPRRASITSMRVPEGPHMGVLGASHLGDAPVTKNDAKPFVLPLDARETRRRELRLSTMRQASAELAATISKQKKAGLVTVIVTKART